MRLIKPSNAVFCQNILYMHWYSPFCTETFGPTSAVLVYYIILAVGILFWGERIQQGSSGSAPHMLKST